MGEIEVGREMFDRGAASRDAELAALREEVEHLRVAVDCFEKQAKDQFTLAREAAGLLGRADWANAISWPGAPNTTDATTIYRPIPKEWCMDVRAWLQAHPELEEPGDAPKGKTDR